MAPIRPTSVAGPVATATPMPRPAATSVPEKAIEDRSPIAAAGGTGSTDLAAAADSPVSTASSALRPQASISRRSAGTRSPGSSRTMSPGTTSAAGSCRRTPPRRTEASTCSIRRTVEIAFSARPSCQTPTAAFSTTTARITAASVQWPSRAVISPAARSTWISRLAN